MLKVSPRVNNYQATSTNFKGKMPSPKQIIPTVVEKIKKPSKIKSGLMIATAFIAGALGGNHLGKSEGIEQGRKQEKQELVHELKYGTKNLNEGNVKEGYRTFEVTDTVDLWGDPHRRVTTYDIGEQKHAREEKYHDLETDKNIYTISRPSRAAIDSKIIEVDGNGASRETIYDVKTKYLPKTEIYYSRKGKVEQASENKPVQWEWSNKTSEYQKEQEIQKAYDKMSNKENLDKAVDDLVNSMLTD